MPTHYRHVARAALEEGLCMGNPEIGTPGCHRPPAEGRHHGRCQLCQDIWNLWRRERNAARRAQEACQTREDALFILLGNLRGKRRRLALWVVRQLGYELDDTYYLKTGSNEP